MSRDIFHQTGVLRAPSPLPLYSNVNSNQRYVIQAAWLSAASFLFICLIGGLGNPHAETS